MPARRRSLRHKSKKKHAPKKKLYFVLLILFVVSVLTLFKGEKWDKSSKISVAFLTEAGDVQVAVFDPTANSITNIIIPADTEVVVARNFGKLRIKNVFKLGESEEVGGDLLSETITRYFKFPNKFWSSEFGFGLTGKNVFSLTKSVFVPYRTNLSLPIKMQLALFSLSVKDSQRYEIDLAETSFLSQVALRDGDTGYVLSNKAPNQVMLLFTDDYISNNETTVSMVDATGSKAVSESLGRVLEAMGAKTAVVQRVDESDFDCTVSSSDEVLREKFTSLLGCEPDDTLSNFDAVISIGTAFSERY